MRILVLIGLVIALVLWMRYVRRTMMNQPSEAAKPEAAPSPPPTPEPDGSETALEVELREAVAAFEESRRQVGMGADTVRAAVASLIEQTHQLERRVIADEAFSRRVRQPVKRLLLSLYSVVRQASSATNTTPNAERDSLLDAASDAIRRSADQLGRITEKADEVALQRLESDLEVLESRLSQRSETR